MRSALLVVSLALVQLPSLAAQQPTRPAFVLSAGPTWDHLLTGLHLRAEYNLRRGRWLGFRVEAGGRWTPTQSFSRPSALYGDGSRFQGTAQFADFHLGVAATLTPWPRGSLSPYLVIGAEAVQTWSSSEGFYENPQGGLAYASPRRSGTHGGFAGVAGLGLTLRLSGRPIQFEIRRVGLLNDLTIGTGLRF